MKEKQEFLEAVLEAAYRFRIKVEDNQALPEDLKKHAEISFSLKSPTMGVLFQISRVFLEIPKADLAWLNTAADFSARLRLIERYTGKLLEVIALLLHGKESHRPAWYVPFLRANLTKSEVLELLTESLVRLDTAFF